MWLLDKLYGIDAEEQRAAELTAANEALSARKRAEGKVTEEVYQAQLENYRRFGADGLGGDAEFSDDIEAEFDAGLKEGAANVTSVLETPFKIVGTGVGAVLKSFPWWLWAGGLVAAAWLAWPFLAPLLGARLKRGR